jgi:hypothetical protein
MKRKKPRMTRLLTVSKTDREQKGIKPDSAAPLISVVVFSSDTALT